MATTQTPTASLPVRTREYLDAEALLGPDAAVAETSDVTASRAIRPPVAVPNRRLSTHTFGEALLTWRCLRCGDVGHLSTLPTACACGAPRTDLAYEIED